MGICAYARVSSLRVEAAPGVGAGVEALFTYSEQVVGVQRLDIWRHLLQPRLHSRSTAAPDTLNSHDTELVWCGSTDDTALVYVSYTPLVVHGRLKYMQ